MKSKINDICGPKTVMSIIGNKWNLLIIWHLKDQTLRFTELQKKMYNINPKTITKHLRDLEENKIIKRVVYAEVPPRVEYSLTDAGIAFIPILESILEWGSQYMGFKLDEYL
jgi:DNA-binding HxlR family transcriptional regulator